MLPRNIFVRNMSCDRLLLVLSEATTFWKKLYRDVVIFNLTTILKHSCYLYAASLLLKIRNYNDGNIKSKN